MPGYKTHVGFAVCIYALWLIVVSLLCGSFSLSVVKGIEWFLCIIIGSLFPDVDIKSKGQVIFYEIMVGILVLLWWRQELIAFTWLTFVALIPVLVHHRGLFHNILFLMCMPLLAALFFGHYYPSYATLLCVDAGFFSLGAVSHCILDRFVSKVKKKRY